MQMLNRRDFCLCLACSAGAFAARAEGDQIYTCNLSFDALASTVDKSTIKPLDPVNQGFANGLVAVLTDITSFLGITLNLFTYDDRTAANAAFTADQSYRPPRWVGPTAKDGIILLGEQFITELEAYFGSLGAPLTALCAHEAGHSLQAKYGLGEWNSYAIKPVEDDFYQDRYELCADFICGYVASHRKTIDKTYPAALQAVTQFNKGNEKPQGHGTFKQRGEAVAAGYRFGKTGAANSEAALRAGFEYVFTVQFVE
ncbi:hypothetical protein [Rhizobium leguminosarum]